jgi:hypothetical protein
MYQLYLITILFNYLFNLSHQYTYQGYATIYGGKVYGGSCGFKSLWTNTIPSNYYQYGVAINSKQYNNSLACGTCLQINYNQNTAPLSNIQNNIINYQIDNYDLSNSNGNNIIVVVTDICPECKFGDLDLFQESYNKLIAKDPGRYKISWDIVNCPEKIVSNNIQLRIDEINYYWLSIQPENFKCQISDIYIYQNNNWVLMERDDLKMTGLFFNYKIKLEMPIKFKIRNKFFEEIITPEFYNLENLFILDSQFKCDNPNNLLDNILDCEE